MNKELEQAVAKLGIERKEFEDAVIRIVAKTNHKLDGEIPVSDGKHQLKLGRNGETIRALLEKYGGVKFGHFKLPNGRHCTTFYNLGTLYKHPEWETIREILADEFLKRFGDADEVDCLMAHSEPMYYVAQCLADKLAKRYKTDTPSVIGVVGYPPNFSLQWNPENGLAGKRCALMEDVINQGYLVETLVKLVQCQGGEIIKILAVVSVNNYSNHTLPLEILYNTFVTHYENTADCPLCQEELPYTIVKPNISIDIPEDFPSELSDRLKRLDELVDKNPHFWKRVHHHRAIRLHRQIKLGPRETHLIVPFDIEVLLEDKELTSEMEQKLAEELTPHLKKLISQRWVIVHPPRRPAKPLRLMTDLLTAQFKAMGKDQPETVEMKIKTDGSFRLPAKISLTNKCVLIADTNALGGRTLKKMINLIEQQGPKQIVVVICINRLREKTEQEIRQKISDGRFVSLYRFPLPGFEYSDKSICPYCQLRARLKEILVSLSICDEHKKLLRHALKNPPPRKKIFSPDVKLEEVKEWLRMMFTPHLAEGSRDIEVLSEIMSQPNQDYHLKVTFLRSLKCAEKVVKEPGIVKSLIHPYILNHPNRPVMQEGCEVLMANNEYSWLTKEHWLTKQIENKRFVEPNDFGRIVHCVRRAISFDRDNELPIRNEIAELYQRYQDNRKVCDRLTQLDNEITKSLAVS